MGSCLEDALVLFDGVIQFLAFLDIHGTRLFTIDILTRASGKDGGHGMPAVTRVNGGLGWAHAACITSVFTGLNIPGAARG